MECGPSINMRSSNPGRSKVFNTESLGLTTTLNSLFYPPFKYEKISLWGFLLLPPPPPRFLFVISVLPTCVFLGSCRIIALCLGPFLTWWATIDILSKRRSLQSHLLSPPVSPPAGWQERVPRACHLSDLKNLPSGWIETTSCAHQAFNQLT